jgi:uncharacterized small protein (DUF1192 family)
VDSSVAIIVAGFLIAAGGWGIPYYSMRNNSRFQADIVNQSLAEKANKDVVEALNQRITALQEDVHRAQEDSSKKGDEITALRAEVVECRRECEACEKRSDVYERRYWELLAKSGGRPPEAG